MHWITATDLVHWAGTRNAESDLPLLIRRLILASVENVGHLAIPSGDSIFRPGWDGLLNAAKSSWPVPEGISVWELGKTKDVLTKANEDFNKRTTKPRGVLPEDATFVFVTPRRWPDKKQDKAAWCSARIAESNWRDVRVLDADDLEVWLDQSPSVASWFARRIGKQPEGIEGLDTFWERSISDTSTRLTPGIILAGRDVFCSAIEAWAESDEPLLRIKGDTPEEAVLLLAAWALRERGPAEEFLFARAIVVHTQEAWRQVTATNRPLILLPLFDGGSLGVGEVTKSGHWVIIPSGWNASEDFNLIVAPWLDRWELKAALEKEGMDEARAQQVSSNCGRSLQVLTRQLSITPERRCPPWASHEDRQAIIPLLLAGRWDSRREGDREAASKLAGGMAYDHIEDGLNLWLHVADSPVRKYGSVFLLTSPMDAWSQLGNRVTREAWHRYGDLIIEVLNKRDPALDLPPENRWQASIYGKEFEVSGALRKGLVEQLARLAGAEDRIKLSVDPGAASVAARVLSECLSPAEDIERWRSLSDLLPTLAEAAPDAFLDCLEVLIENREVAARVFESTEPLFSTSLHVYIMWAIESIRWFPEYLRRCTEVLLKLSTIDPGGNSEPRPASIFCETFLILKPANSVKFDDQVNLLKTLSAKYLEALWPLLLSLVDRKSRILVKSGPRYRAANNTPDLPSTWGDAFERTNRIVELLINLADSEIKRWVDLAESIDRLLGYEKARTTLTHALNSFIDRAGVQGDALVPLYHKLMDTVRRHQAYSDADWALPPQEIAALEKLASKVQPTDPLELHRWLFEDDFPSWKLEGDDKALQKMRTDAVKDIYAASGIAGLEQLAMRTHNAWLVGSAIGSSGLGDEQQRESIRYFITRSDSYLQAVIRSIVSALYSIKKLQLPSFVERYAAGIDGVQFGRFAIGLPRGPETWDLVEQRGSESETAYWHETHAYIGDDTDIVTRATQALLRHDMIPDAIRTVSLSRCPLPSGIILELLDGFQRLPGKKFDGRIFHNILFHIEKIFTKLDSNKDISEEKLILLELNFLPFLKDGKRGFLAITKHIKTHPDFFVELLRAYYNREDGLEDEDIKLLSYERRNHLRQTAFDILNDFDAIPCLDKEEDDAPLDLRTWITRALEIAKSVHRKGYAVSKIGDALARAPVNENGPWPRDHICDVMEEFWSDKLASGFTCGCVSKLGVRYVGEGEPDAELAEKYAAWAKNRELTHPRVSRLLRNLAARFDRYSEGHRSDAEYRRQVE